MTQQSKPGTKLLVSAHYIDRRFAGIRDIHLGAYVTDAPDDLLIMLHDILCLREVPRLVIYRPPGHHQRFLFRDQLAVDLFRYEGHIRVQKLQRILKHLPQNPQCVVGALGIFLGMIDTVLRKFDIPVAELVPQEIIDLRECDTKLELVHIFRHFFDQAVALRQDPAVARMIVKILRLFQFLPAKVHQDES